MKYYNTCIYQKYFYLASIKSYICSSLLECTLVGLIDSISGQSLPFWWDDANKFAILEQLAVLAYNKVAIRYCSINIAGYFQRVKI